MKLLLADNEATATLAFQLKSGTFDHLRNAAADDRTAILSSLFPNTGDANVYVLSGVINTGSGTSYIISGGWAYCNQLAVSGGSQPYEIFQVLANTFTSSSPIVWLLVSYVSAANADPTALNTGGTANIHQVRQLLIADSGYTPPSGTLAFAVGSLTFSDLVYLTSNGEQVYDFSSKITATGGSFSSPGGKLAYHIVGNLLTFQFSMGLNIGSAVTHFNIDFSEVFTTASDGVGFSIVTVDFGGANIATNCIISAGSSSMLIQNVGNSFGVSSNYQLYINGSMFIV